MNQKNKCLNCESENVKIIQTKDFNQKLSNVFFSYCVCKNCQCITNLSNLKNLDFFYKNLNNPSNLSDLQYLKIKKKNYYFWKFAL